MPVSPIQGIAKGLGYAVITTILAVIISGVIFKVTPLSEKYLPWLAFTVLIISAGLGGFIAARAAGERGLVQGISVGALYTGVIMVIALVIGAENLDATAGLLRLGCSLFGGGLGGILGVASR